MRIHPNRIKLTAVLFSLVGFGLFLVVWSVSPSNIILEPVLAVEAGEMPELSTASYLVLDLESGTEVLSKNSTEKLPIASVTKLFTAAAFKEHTHLSGTTTITWGDVATEGRAGKLQAGEVYPYHELVEALIVESSNDAASTIARVDVGVIDRMNEYPATFGFSNTQFADPSGLSSHNESTAYELAQLSRHLWFTEPYVFDVSNMPEIIGTYTGWVNNNPLRALSGYKGGKHGFTYEAGRTAVAVFTEEIGGHERDFLYVILGSDDLVGDITGLRSYVGNNVSYE